MFLDSVLNYTRFSYEFKLFSSFSREALCSSRILYEAIAVRYSVLSPPALCYCCAFAFVLPRKYHAIAAHIANYISIEFTRTDNFVPLPTLRQLKYVSPNGKTVDSRVTRRILLCFHSRICNNTLSGFVVATYRLTYHEGICTLPRNVIGSSLMVLNLETLIILLDTSMYTALLF